MNDVESVQRTGSSSVVDVSLTKKMEIPEFYAGKSVFLTGATGFMGKVLLEKLLRCLDVSAVYILIRPKKGIKVQDRLAELFKAPLLENLAAIKPNCKEKVFPVTGDTSLPNYGICESDLLRIFEEISVVFHCAASVKFQEPLLLGRNSIDANVRSVKGIIDLIKKMKRFEVLVYLSTAYAHCYKQNIEEMIYPTDASPDDVLKCADWMSREMMEKLLDDLCVNHPNTYTYTKALAENLVSNSDIKRSVIVRPSIVTSTWKEPMPGWCDSINGPVGLIISFGKGLLRTMLGNRDSVANFVPVDIAVNLMIAGGWRSATMSSPGDQASSLTIYNCTNSEDNEFTWGDLSDCVISNAKLVPLENPIWLPAYGSSITPKYFKYQVKWAMCHWLPAYLADTALAITRRKRRFVHLYTKIRNMCDSLGYFTMRSWRWSNKNVKNLLDCMSVNDRKVFYIDFSDLDWKHHMADYHVGVKKYILKENMDNIPRTAKKLSRLLYFGLFAESCMVLSLLVASFKFDWTTETGVISMFCIYMTFSLLSRLRVSAK